MNKKGKIRARVLSFALSLSVTMLNLPIHQVAHAAADTTIPEPLTAAFSIPIYGNTAYIPYTDKEIRKIPLQEAKGWSNV